ncbi:MAG: hypothetical protein H0V74_06695 [Chloroflexi bacterium]|nr:hypothetical protein [Chloroflexota bacterium]
MATFVRALLVAGTLLALSAVPALATHTHVMSVGNGQCVVLAEGAGEEDVALPLAVFDHNPNVTIAPTAGRMHPLHVLVHKGVPGTNHQMEVAGTAAATALCSAGYVNR